MNIDIKNLSSKELFELAKRKEKEELEANQRASRLAEVKKQKAQLIARHEDALATADKAIRDLQEKRKRIVAEFETALAPIELDIQELERKVEADQARAESQDPSAPVDAAAKMPPPGAPALRPVAPSAPAPGATAQKLPSNDSQTKKQIPAGQEIDSSEELMDRIRHIMRSRTYISESLLKEKLKSNGFDTTDLKKEMDKLIREGRLEKKGSGNFALGKRK